MKARGLVAHGANQPLERWEFERRSVGENDVQFEIAYAGICHSDIHLVREEWGKSLFPMVPGHEIVGHVTEVGAKVTKFKVGDRIGVGVFIDSCRNCKYCKADLAQYCEEGMTLTYNTYERNTKNIAFGGYSTNFVIDQDYAVHIPKNLDLAAVAPLLCAGITLYSPIRHWNVKPGMEVAIMGLGGLGHMGLKFAVALGANVSVLSHSESKREDALKMGAKNFYVIKSKSDLQSLNKKFDLILNTISADIEVEPYIETLAVDGTMVVVGIPMNSYSVHPKHLLGARRAIAGSTIGSIGELQEMLDFAGKHNIVSDIELINADYVDTAFKRTVASDVKYRFVIDASTI